jgi:hypothetical protein
MVVTDGPPARHQIAMTRVADRTAERRAVQERDDRVAAEVMHDGPRGVQQPAGPDEPTISTAR